MCNCSISIIVIYNEETLQLPQMICNLLYRVKEIFNGARRGGEGEGEGKLGGRGRCVNGARWEEGKEGVVLHNPVRITRGH